MVARVLLGCSEWLLRRSGLCLGCCIARVIWMVARVLLGCSEWLQDTLGVFSGIVLLG